VDDRHSGVLSFSVGFFTPFKPSPLAPRRLNLTRSHLALSPMWLMPAFAIMVLALGFIVGPTYGAVLAILVSSKPLAAAGMLPEGCSMVAGLALMLGYARPAFGWSLL
jgi:hypothetical protein